MTTAVAAPVCSKCALHAESVFRVAGMDCAEEALILERRLTPLAGVEALNVDVMGQKMRVSYDAAVVTAAAIADAVAETGMKAWLEHERPIETPSSDASTWPLAAAGVAVAGGLAVQFVAADPRWGWPLFAAAVLLAGRQPARKGLASLGRRVLDIHVLMLIAVTGALVLGDWAEAATVIWLFAVSQWLEVRTMERARRAIRGVMTLAPTEARVRHGDHEHDTAVDLVLPGAIIIVAPGQKVPLDGVVVAGVSDLNQAPITGESLPVARGVGDEVFAGTINGQGALDVRVTRAVRDTTLARIVHLVEAAQAERAPAQQFIDRFARWYTPAVVAGALAVFLVPVVALGGSAAEWAYRALVLLVVACPCALVISTPVSIVAALATAAKRGVLIKGGAHLERLAGVKVVAFDKTGTLTTGEPQVVSILAMGGADQAEALTAAAAIEQRSAHPIADAIVEAARARTLALQGAEDVRDLPGRGAEGRWRGRHVLVGNPALLRERDVTTDTTAIASDFGARGETAVFVAIDGVVQLAIGVADRPRAVAADVVRLLKGQGISHVALLTGDTAASAVALAAITGVTDVRAGLLPGEKLAAVKALRAAYGPVAMVGDGVNDAPALAAADVGVAMGAVGSAAALEAADVALMSDELQKLPYAIRLSRATLANVRVNIAISLGLKVGVLVLAVFGMSTLWMAVVADTGASVLVVANAMRLLRHQ